MEKGILIAIGESGTFQIVREVDSIEDANIAALEYMTYGPENDCVAPYEFQLHGRGEGGLYNRVVRFEPVAL
jgi:hypothetical protein